MRGILLLPRYDGFMAVIYVPFAAVVLTAAVSVWTSRDLEGEVWTAASWFSVGTAALLNLSAFGL